MSEIYDPAYEDFDDDEIDAWEDAMMDCGWDGIRGHGCAMAGSEHCDFDCPFRDELYGIGSIDTPQGEKKQEVEGE